MNDVTGRARAPHLGPDRRRPQVLDAARSIALRAGAANVKIATVAHELGLTRPVVYSCFSDRTALLDSMAEREVSLLKKNVLLALHSAAGIDDHERAFIAGFRALLGTVAEHGDSWRLALLDEPEPVIYARFAAARKEVAAAAEAWLGPAIRDWWDIEDVDRKMPLLIDFFMNTCEGALRLALSTDETFEMDELASFYGRVTFHALAAS